MKDMTRHIQEYLQEKRPEMVEFLKRLVRFETPSRDPEAQTPILAFIGEKLKDLSYKVNLYPGKETGGFLMAMPLNRKKGAPLQLLIGHCDTVWKKNTLSEMPITEEENRLSGPGIFDMKAGLTQMIFTLQAIRDLGLEFSVTPVLLINSDEEIGSRESSSTICKLARIADRAFVLEPPLGLGGKLKTERKGIGRFTVTVRGKPAHAGLNPDKGVSAIVELSYQIQHLFSLNDFEKGITVNVGMIQGGSSANVIAEESRAVVDVRVSNMEDALRIEKEIMSLKPKQEESEVRVEGYFGRPPMERTPRNKRLWSLARDMGSLLGLELEEAAAGGGSDGNTTSEYTATLDGLGTTGDGAHARHEHIVTEKLVERTALLTLLVVAKSLNEESISTIRKEQKEEGAMKQIEGLK